MTCRCWRVIGEHYLCREHGGGDCWSAAVKKLKPKPRDECPPEAMYDLQNEWWAFLDKPMCVNGRVQLTEMVP